MLYISTRKCNKKNAFKNWL